MKKMKFALFLIGGICSAQIAFADEYQDCMNTALSDNDMVACTDAETSRVMRKLQSRYNMVATNKYFISWNDKTLSAAQNFQLLFRQWVEYRDKYCSLYGYTFAKDQGTLSAVQKSQCLLDMTNRFSTDVDAIIKVYNNVAVTN